jgi:hypothetical protein
VAFQLWSINSVDRLRTIFDDCYFSKVNIEAQRVTGLDAGRAMFSK